MTCSCDICGKEIARQRDLMRHQQSKKCQALREKILTSSRKCDCHICGRSVLKKHIRRHHKTVRCMEAQFKAQLKLKGERIRDVADRNKKEIDRLKEVISKLKTDTKDISTSESTYASKGESECRRVLEDHYKKPFPSVRPSWLKNSVTGRNLELDCFNEELGIAVEYNGQQHYKYSPKFHRYSRINFHNQVYRDEKTVILTKKKGVRLVVVPYTVPFDEIRSFILTRLDDTRNVLGTSVKPVNIKR